MLELKMNEISNLPAVTFNFDELKRELEENLEKYQGLIISENAIQEGKNTRANLNKLAKAINDKKIEIKRQYTEPYTVFESQIKELLSMIEKPILQIDSQIKKFDEDKKVEKKLAIERIFYAEIQKLGDIAQKNIKLEQIFDERWLNFGVKIKEAEELIKFKIEKIESDLKAIANLETNFKAESLNHYFKTLDLGKVLEHKNNLENIQRENEAQTKRKLQQQPQQPQQPQQKYDPGIVREVKILPTPEPEIQKILTVDFRVKATKETLLLLKGFLIEHKIEFGKVE